MQRSEISLPGDWPHLQTTSCFAHVVRHCLDTLHLACVFFDKSVSQNTPKPKNLRTGTVACSLREATELFKLRFQKESHSTNVFIKGFVSFQLCRACAMCKSKMSWSISQPWPGHRGMLRTFLHQGGTQEHSALTNNTVRGTRARFFWCHDRDCPKHFRPRSIKCYAQS